MTSAEMDKFVQAFARQTVTRRQERKHALH